MSAIGCGLAETLASLREGRSGIGPVKYLETTLRDFPVGEAPFSNAEMAARTGARADLPRTSLLSILALQEALETAGLRSPAVTGHPIPLISGTTVGGMDLSEKTYPVYSPLH